MTDTETDTTWTKVDADYGPEPLARRTRALELAINFHIDTTIHNAEYLREVARIDGVELRPTHHKHVIATAAAFDAFLRGSGPFLFNLSVRVADKATPPDEPPTENEDGRQDTDPG